MIGPAPYHQITLVATASRSTTVSNERANPIVMVISAHARSRHVIGSRAHPVTRANGPW